MSFVEKLLAEGAKELSHVNGKAAANGVKALAKNGKTSTQNVVLEGAGFAIAEITSMAVGLGAVAVADQAIPFVLNPLSKGIGQSVVLPNIDAIENTLQKYCRLEECQPDKTKSKEERARNFAHNVLVFGTSWFAAMASKLVTRRIMNTQFGVADHSAKGFLNMTRKEAAIFGADELTHVVSLASMNTSMAKPTDEFIKTCKTVLINCGVPESKAQEISTYFVVWEVPNLLGLMAGLSVIGASHKYPNMFPSR